MIVHIKTKIGETLNTRDEADKLFQELISLNPKEEIVFDFSDVIFMSRSFADEFFVEYRKLINQNRSVIIKNATIQILDIIKAVDNTYNKENTYSYIEYPKYSFTNYNQLNNYLQAL